MNNIFICCGNLKAGGAERVISVLANDFVSRDISVCIYTWYKTDIFYQFDDRVIIHQIPLESKCSSYLGQMLWFRKEILHKHPDVVLSFLAPFNILTVFSLLGTRIPVAVAERNDPYFVSPTYNAFWKIVRNLAYKFSDRVFVQTQINKSHFPRYIQSKSTVIYNPMALDRDKIGLALSANKRKEIVSVTRLEAQKNVPMLIKAFAKFHKTHLDYRLTIYGKGGERGDLEKLISSMGLTEVVSLPGCRQDVHNVIVGASMFAMASNFEGMSNSLIEAMCLGLPCVSTKVSGALDLIQNGYNGLLVDINDIDGMCSALTYMADNIDFSKRMGERASELYKMLSVDVISTQWLKEISAIIK